MIYWIKKISKTVSAGSFFIIFFLSLDFYDPLNTGTVAWAFFKGGGAAVLVWLCSFLLADIILKNLLEDIDDQKNDVLDDGLLQRVREEKERSKYGIQQTGKKQGTTT
ncbi:MAG: hypothetical protein GF401_10510 [Chitinivibrionales bacterium]|nr:hypothetical protein [Chitinivibrionales bacterium]